MHPNVTRLISLYASLRNLIVVAVVVANETVKTASNWVIPAGSTCFNLHTLNPIPEGSPEGTVATYGDPVTPLPIGVSPRGTLFVAGLASYPSSMNAPVSDVQPVQRNAYRGMWDVCIWLDSFVGAYRQRAASSVAFPQNAPALSSAVTGTLSTEQLEAELAKRRVTPMGQRPIDDNKLTDAEILAAAKPELAPVGISAETGQNTAELTAIIQGEKKSRK